MKFLVAALLAITALSARAEFAPAPHVQAELVSEYDALAPGTNWVALRLVPEPGWHTYYKTPGDTGLPTTLAWTLPAGFSAGAIQWPPPETFHVGGQTTYDVGGQTTYGYSRATLHLVAITVPRAATGDATLTAQASWLACKDLCIPGKATLTLTLPARPTRGAPTRWASAFADTRSFKPRPESALSPDSSPESPRSSSVAAPSFALVIGFALLGGLILNLMPCVFPVLSIKAVSILEAQGRERRHQRAHALAYTAGVVSSCLAAATAILALRGLGHALGWGFQLQSPVFVASMAYLLFALALSLSGLVQFGTSIMGVGQSLAVRGGYAGSFVTGVLAVVVASPCTAPFMGTALGYALAQPAAIALVVFAALGLGLALPFLAIGFVPALARALPRPGAWMETFKQAMAFPLYLTVAWLVWILARQAGTDAVPVVLSGFVFIGAASWLLSHRGVASRGLRYAALAVALGLLFAPALRPSTAAAASAPAAAAWEPYSDERLAQLLGEGRPVFVDLTADWCITCKVNERVAIDTDAVQAAFAKRGVAQLRGDWTHADAAITRVLTQFGRAGVPLYLLYGAHGEPVVLPQLLTREGLVAEIERLG